MSQGNFLERLLSGVEVERKPLRTLIETVTAPSKLNRDAYRAKGRLPIIDQGIDFIAGYTDQQVTPVEAGQYIIFGDHSEHIKYVDFYFVQGADGIKILRPVSGNAKYVYYAFSNFYQRESSYKRHWSTAQETLIPIPYPNDPEKSLAEQARIAAILDQFDALTNSLTEGLPREIELRQKQYAYYRDLLFRFPKPASSEA
jgi:type I restriction enzyme S subunit